MPVFAIILTDSIIICNIIAGIAYLEAIDQLWIMAVVIEALFFGTMITLWLFFLFFQFF
ncbi:MAG: hypothetical protein ACFFAH_12485 [Promethearchaeota archaeon]